MDRDKVIDKIQKLRAVATGGGTEEEMMSFAAKAAKLMADWDIAEEELIEAGVSSTPGVGCSLVTIKYINPWRRAIVGELAQMCSCYALFVKGTTTVEVWGRPEKRNIFEELFQDLEKQVVLVARKLYPGDHTRARRAESGLGFAVANKIHQSWSYQNAEIHGLKALVVQELAQGEEAARGRGGKITSGRPLVMRPGEEFAAGAEAASLITIHKGVK